MAKSIFRSVMFAAFFAAFLAIALLTVSLFSVYESRIADELRLEADYLVHALDQTPDPLEFFRSFPTGHRITLIEGDGTVLYDSLADETQMENHLLRPEVSQALSAGSGESTRTSDTLSETTIYCARRTSSGSVIRIAAARQSVLGFLAGVLPQLVCMLLGVIVLSLLIARISARRIVAPINGLNLDLPLENAAYHELAPLISRMDRQQTELREQMQALDNARTELSAILENMREGMVLLNPFGVVLSMNESAARIFSVQANACIGQSMLHVSRDAKLSLMLQSAQFGQCGELLMPLNGRTYQLSASPVKRADSIYGAALLMQDVTERIAAEESRKEFTANVSHELKTPLTSISGYAEIIRDGIAQPQDTPAFAGKICSEAQRLISLVNDILQLSRLDEKQQLGEKETVFLRSLLQELTDSFAAIADKKHIALSLSGSDGCIAGIPMLLREMFFNLIDNAVKYTAEGGWVRISVSDEGDTLTCTVADNGIGIPQEHQPHVFERFYRVDKSHSRATGGTGLGLAIVKHAAQIHNASVILESSVGEGTSVSVRFQKMQGICG